MHRNNSSNGTGKPSCAPFTGRLIVRRIQCTGGMDARRSECCCVMQQIGIQTLSHPKGYIIQRKNIMFRSRGSLEKDQKITRIECSQIIYGKTEKNDIFRRADKEAGRDGIKSKRKV